MEKGLVSVGIALNGDVFEGEQSFFGEGFDGVGGAFSELGDGHAFGTCCLKEGEDGVLSFGTFSEFFEDFGVDILGCDGLFNRFFGVIFLANGFGEERAHNVLEWGAVIA